MLVTQTNSMASERRQRGSRSTQKLSDERLSRKRALDREAQRSSRCKTKNHIALLESRVEALTRVQANGNTKELMDQIESQRKEIEALKSTLKSVAKLVNSRDESLGSPQNMDVKKNPETPDNQDLGQEDELKFSNDLEVEDLPDGLEFSNEDVIPQPGSSLMQQNYGQIVVQRSQQNSSATLEMLFDLSTAGGTFQNIYGMDTIPSIPPPIPSSVWQPPMDCCDKCEHNKIINFANDLLESCAKMQLKNNLNQNSRDADIPIRAVLHGWQSVTKKYSLDPLWSNLRHADEIIFSKLAPMERLVTLRLVCNVLRYQANPTQSNLNAIPVYLHERPSQRLIPHRNIVDYVCWPLLRERLVFQPHRYCAASFAALFFQSLRFAWAYSFRDSYTRNRATGLYQYSVAFDSEVTDLGNFCMTPDFLEVFPDMKADLPSTDTKPGYIWSGMEEGCLATRW